MTGKWLNPTYKNGGDCGMVYDIALPLLIVNVL